VRFAGGADDARRDVAADDMCGVTVNQVFPANEKWHPLLIEALSGIPDVKAGDSVWWHADMIHSVDPVVDQKGWGNVMYISAAPWCPRNETYAASVMEPSAPDQAPATPRGTLRTPVGQPFPGSRPERHRTPRTRNPLSTTPIVQPQDTRVVGILTSGTIRRPQHRQPSGITQRESNNLMVNGGCRGG
jgi:hypothetical protein